MFADRMDAGRQLAEKLAELGIDEDTVVLGIPRGGVAVAAEVAREFDLPLDVVVAAKVGAPGNSEYAIGAVSADGEVYANPVSGFTAEEVRNYSGPALAKVHHSLAAFRGGLPPLSLEDRTALVVDDGLATGLTALAAVEYVRRAGADHVILAVPVAVSRFDPLAREPCRRGRRGRRPRGVLGGGAVVQALRAGRGCRGQCAARRGGEAGAGRGVALA